jgi:hypothetical protein
MPTNPFTDVWHFLTATTNDYLHQGNWRYRRPESAAARRFGRPDPGESTSQRRWQ